MSTTISVGNAGETRAAEYLESLGYSIIERNFRAKVGEIDIIALKEDVVVIVEVKTRASEKFASASDYVTRAKQRKLKNTALMWMKIRQCEPPLRFDVIEVYATGKINHITDAFR